MSSIFCDAVRCEQPSILAISLDVMQIFGVRTDIYNNLNFSNVML